MFYRPGPRGNAGLYKNQRSIPGLHVKHSKVACFVQAGNFTSKP